jgi:hypothetical protein
MKQDFSYLRSTVRKGLAQMANQPKTDDMIDQYMKLKPSDFKTLMEKYGEEPVIGYIKTMEARRMKTGQGV